MGVLRSAARSPPGAATRPVRTRGAGSVAWPGLSHTRSRHASPEPVLVASSQGHLLVLRGQTYPLAVRGGERRPRNNDERFSALLHLGLRPGMIRAGTPEARRGGRPAMSSRSSTAISWRSARILEVAAA